MELLALYNTVKHKDYFFKSTFYNYAMKENVVQYYTQKNNKSWEKRRGREHETTTHLIKIQVLPMLDMLLNLVAEVVAVWRALDRIVWLYNIIILWRLSTKVMYGVSTFNGRILPNAENG